MDDISKYGFPSPTVVIISPVPLPGPAGPQSHSTESQEPRNMAFETQEGGGAKLNI